MALRASHSRRRFVSVVSMLVLAAVVSQPATIAAQDATPAATPVATPGTAVDGLVIPTGIDVDLAAMTLLPEEIDPAFASAGGYLGGPMEVAGGIGQSLGMTPDDVAHQLDELGFVAQYVNQSGELNEADPTVFARYAASYVTAFEDSEGAEAGFELIEDESGDPDAEDVQGAPQLGDQSELTRVETIDPVAGDELSVLDYTFRTDNLIGGISMVAIGTSDPPTEDAIVALAE